MLAFNFRRTAGGSARPQHGAFTVELALVLILFLSLLFGVMEVARAMYLFNTLQEVTRRAASEAASIDFRETALLKDVQRKAIFRKSDGVLVLGAPVTELHVRIDYLALVRNGDNSLEMREIPDAKMPSCPAVNRHICMANPNDESCIRFVRARICRPGTGNACVPESYSAMLPLVPLPVRLPVSATIATAESLGFVPGTTPCP